MFVWWEWVGVYKDGVVAEGLNDLVFVYLNVKMLEN